MQILAKFLIKHQIQLVSCLYMYCAYSNDACYWLASNFVNYRCVRLAVTDGWC